MGNLRARVHAAGLRLGNLRAHMVDGLDDPKTIMELPLTDLLTGSGKTIMELPLTLLQQQSQKYHRIAFNNWTARRTTDRDFHAAG